MINPGQVCPTCERRAPYPKRSDSPKSVMHSFRCPTQEEADTMVETENAAIEYVGLDGSKFIHWKLYTLGLVAILQDDKMKGWAKK